MYAHGTFFPRSWIHAKIPASCQRWSGWGRGRGAESPPTPGEWVLSWMILWSTSCDDVVAATHEQRIKGMPTVGREGSRMWGRLVLWYSTAESHRSPPGYLQTHPGYAWPMQKWPCSIIDSLLSQLEHSLYWCFVCFLVYHVTCHPCSEWQATRLDTVAAHLGHVLRAMKNLWLLLRVSATSSLSTDMRMTRVSQTSSSHWEWFPKTKSPEWSHQGCLLPCTTNRSSNCLWNQAWPLAAHQFCRGSFVCSLWPPSMSSGVDQTATDPSTLGQQYFRGGNVCWTVAGQGVELLPWGICCLPMGLSPW